MRIPVVEGREFTERDIENSAGVAVVDQTLVKKYWPGRSPLGQHFKLQGHEYEVVGVVGDVKHSSLNEEPTATVYAPFSQVNVAALPFFANGFSVVVRTESDPLTLGTAVRRELHAVDGNVPASSVKSMDQFLSAAVGPRRFNLELMAIFAAAALLLAAMGLYSVISYSVSLRTSEIGMRIALGAGRRAVFRLIVGQGLRLVCYGICAGTLAAIIATRFAYELADPLIFGAVAVLFLGVGAIAAYIPARRASHVDPLVALRSE